MQRVFIIGNPRSGTSLLRLMLNTHSFIAAPPECGFIQWWYDKYGNWDINNASSYNDISNFIKDFATSRKIETWDINYIKLNNYLLHSKPINYGSLCELIYLFWALERNKLPHVIIDKNNYYINFLETIERVWNDAKYIFIIRDGRDVACSYKDVIKLQSDSPYKPKFSSNIETIAQEWIQNQEKAFDFFDTISKNRSIVIRYEDLITKPRFLLTKITSYLNLSFENIMLEYHKYNDEPSLTIDWKKKTLSNIDSSCVGRFKENLNIEDIKTFEKIAKETLLKFNYPLMTI